jgi:hypothetical protein
MAGRGQTQWKNYVKFYAIADNIRIEETQGGELKKNKISDGLG